MNLEPRRWTPRLRALLDDADVRRGLTVGAAAGAVVLALVLHPRWADAPPMPVAAAALAAPDWNGHAASAEARRLVDWVLASGDHGGRPFVVIDKQRAEVLVFEPEGLLAASTPVLLGLAVGDHTVPGIAQRSLPQIAPHERTTPAGRFVARPGRNADLEDVIWVDYGAAVSMHRVRPMHPSERRLERLASATASDNRISNGCVNVPVAFFELELWPRMGHGTGGSVVYVLPEVDGLQAVFPQLPSQPDTPARA